MFDKMVEKSAEDNIPPQDLTGGEGFAEQNQKFVANDTADSEAQLDIEIEKAGGLASLVATGVFSDAAMPKGFMQRYADLVTFANRAAGDLSIGNGAGPVTQKTKQEREEEEREKALDNLQDAADHFAEELKKDREAWDAKMSSDVPGMTQGEVLDLLKMINANPQRYLNLAVQKGIIKEEQKDDLAKYMKLWQQNEEYKRDHKGDSDPALQAQLDANPEFKAAVPVILKDAQADVSELGFSKSNRDGLAQERAFDISSNDAATAYYGTQVENKQIFASAPELSEHFEAAATKEVKPESATPVAKPAIVVAVTNSNDAMM